MLTNVFDDHSVNLNHNIKRKGGEEDATGATCRPIVALGEIRPTR
jgi:hypothetical protein